MSAQTHKQIELDWSHKLSVCISLPARTSSGPRPLSATIGSENDCRFARWTGNQTIMTRETKHCRVCGVEIPPERLEVIPDTLVCVRCSQKMGGEFELEVRMGGTGKVGSLKKTGVEVSIKRQRRRLV